jgi:hypothetical protein
MIAETLNINREGVRLILTAKIVPRSVDPSLRQRNLTHINSHSLFFFSFFPPFRNSIVFLERTAYSHSTASSECFLFSVIKSFIRESHYERVEGIRKVTTTILNNVHWIKFRKCCDSWNQCWVQVQQQEGPLQFRLRFNTMLPVIAVSLFICQTSFSFLRDNIN